MATLSGLQKRQVVVATLSFVLLTACRAIGPRPATPAVPTATVEVLADCFWSADVFAWVDADGDGTRDEGEQPLEGVLVNFSLTFLSAETTGADGTAHVSGMHPGGCDWTREMKLVAKPPEGYEPTTAAAVVYSESRDRYEFGFRHD